MIVASLLLVIVAAATLVVGLFNPETTSWVWASIACCVVAGLLLIAGVMRSRPRRKPVLQSGTDQPASWAGAASWAQPGASAATMEREAPADEGVRVVESAPPAAAPQPPAAPEQTWAPEAPAEPAPPPLPAEPADDTSEMPAAAAAAPAAPAAKRTARKATGSVAASAASGSGSEAEKINAALTGISGVGPAKRQALIAEFSTYRKLRAASVDKLAAVPGVSQALAERIHTALHS